MAGIRVVAAAVLAVAGLFVSSPEALAASADCNGRWFWHYNLELPQGFWSDGVHTYQLRGAMDGVVVFTPPPVTFAVTPAAPMYRGQAQLRFYAVLVYQNGGFGAVGQLNSTQDTVIQVNDDLIGSKQQADAFSARETSEARWDGGPWVAMDEGPVLSFCSFDPARLGVWERQWGPSYRP